MASIEAKQIASSCKTRMRNCVLLFLSTKNTPITVWVYTRSAHSVLRVCMTRKRAVYAFGTNFWSRQHAPSMGLWHARMNVSAGLCDAFATLYLLVRLFLCCVRRENFSSRSCHRDLWQRYNRKAGSSPCCQVAEHSAKKTSKGDVENLFWPRKIWPVTAVPLAYLQVLAYHFGREI